MQSAANTKRGGREWWWGLEEANVRRNGGAEKAVGEEWGMKLITARYGAKNEERGANEIHGKER